MYSYAIYANHLAFVSLPLLPPHVLVVILSYTYFREEKMYNNRNNSTGRIVSRIIGNSANGIIAERNRLFRRNNNNDTPKSKKIKLIAKDVYLLKKDTTTMARGTEKCKLHENGQVITAFQIEGYLSEEQLYERLEECFSSVLDFSHPVPRFEYVKYISGQLVSPTLGQNVSFDSTTVLSISRQGDIYLRATHNLKNIEVMGDDSDDNLENAEQNTPINNQQSRIFRNGSQIRQPGSSTRTLPEQPGSSTRPLPEQPGSSTRPLPEQPRSSSHPQQPSQEINSSTTTGATADNRQNLRDLFPNLTDWQICEILESYSDMEEAASFAAEISEKNEKGATMESLEDVFSYFEKKLHPSRQTLRVEEKHIFSDVLAFYKGRDFDPTKKLRVIIENGPGIDAGGLTRHMFDVVFQMLRKSDGENRYFEGERFSLLPICSSRTALSEIFIYIGKIIGHALLHGIRVIQIPTVAYFYIATQDITQCLEYLDADDGRYWVHISLHTMLLISSSIFFNVKSAVFEGKFCF
eukprot:TCONS_00039383-protein